MDLSSRAKQPVVAVVAAASTNNSEQQQQQPPAVASLTDQLFARKNLVSKVEINSRRNRKAKKEDVSDNGTGKVESRRETEKRRKKHLSHKKDPMPRDEIYRTVFVGNLPNNVTHAQVERFFETKCGDVEAARVRCVHLAPMEEGQKDRGRGVRILRGEIDKTDNASATAYVVFKTVEATDKAIALTGCVFKDRHLSIGGETPEAKPFAPRSSVYLGSLPYSVTDEQVWQFFIEQGLVDVTRVRIPRDHNSSAWGNAKGFGYVEFLSRESVVKALKLKTPQVGGRKIRIFSVHKSKDAIDSKVTRREKRAVAAASAAPNNNKKDNNNNNRQQKPTSSAAAAAGGAEKDGDVRAETPAWMGQTTDPRKKLSKELRWLTQHPNDRRAAAKARHKDRVRAEFIKKKKTAKAA